MGILGVKLRMTNINIVLKVDNCVLYSKLSTVY